MLAVIQGLQSDKISITEFLAGRILRDPSPSYRNNPHVIDHFHENLWSNPKYHPQPGPSDAVSEKSKNASIFIRTVLPNFYPDGGFGIQTGQFLSGHRI